MTDNGDLYEVDFVQWTEEQARTLRRAKNSNLPLDWENLAEEIESLGRSQRRELSSQLRRILRHLLKLQASPAAEPRAGWGATIREARKEIDNLLRDSPSLRRQVQGLIEDEAGIAAELAMADLSQHAEPAAAVRERIEQGGFTAEQVLGDWFPE